MPESDPFLSLRQVCRGQLDRAHDVTGCEIFMVPAYAIKSIVLIDFAHVCQDGTYRSIPAAETTPAKPRGLGNLHESPPVRSTRMCASACSLRNQPCAGAESGSCAETGFTETAERLKSKNGFFRSKGVGSTSRFKYLQSCPWRGFWAASRKALHGPAAVAANAIPG